MKRIRCLFLLLLLLLNGCTARLQDDPLAVLRDSRLVTAQVGDLLFTMEWQEDERCLFVFSSPEILKELTVTLEGKRLHTEYAGLEAEAGETFLAGILPLYRAVSAFRVAETRPEVCSGETPFLRLVLDGTVFLMYYNSDDGSILRMETQDATGTRQYEILSCLPQTQG